MLNSGILRVAPDVGVEGYDDRIYVARLPQGPLIALEGTAALIWEEAQGVDVAAVAERVAEHTGAVAGEIERAVRVFIEDLVSRGLLVIVSEGR